MGELAELKGLKEEVLGGNSGVAEEMQELKERKGIKEN